MIVPSRKGDTYLATVRSEDGELRYTKADLEHGVQSGEISRSSFVHYKPWTGDEFLPIWMLPELTEFRISPEALMIAHLRSQRFPWFSTLCFLLFFVGGLLQLKGWFAEDLVARSTMGWEETILHGHWWNIWTAPLVHLSWEHWFGNIALLYYCSFRVERILGAMGVWLNLTLSLCTGSLLVLCFSEELVVGASTLVFGMWITQISIGFRLVDSMPEKYRSRYGWRNFFLFIPVAILNLYADDVSQLAHLGGILAGGSIGFWYRPVTELIPEKRTVPRIVHLLLGLGLHIVLALSCMWVLEEPKWAAFPWQMIEDREEGYRLQASERLTEAEVLGLRVWHAKADQPRFFASSYWLRSRDDQEKISVQKRWWEDTLGMKLKEIKSPFADHRPIEGWEDLFLGGEDILVWEHSQREGRFILQVGCILPVEYTPSWDICQEFVGSIERIETAEVLAHRRDYQKYTQSPRYALDYAKLLWEYDRWAEIETVYQSLQYRLDQYYWRSIEGRLRLRNEGLIDSRWSEDREWVEDIIHKIPITETKILRFAVDYALAEEQCSWIQNMKDRWALLGEEWPFGPEEHSKVCPDIVPED